jgi:hypothetical protein
MNKIKVVGVLVFTLSIGLAILSNSIAKKNRANITLLEQINRQKAFTQEIAKSIFYLYKKRDSSSKMLEITIQKFLEIERNRLIDSNRKITKLWNVFYLKVANFREKQILLTPYSSMVSEKLVNDIYNINIELIVSFDRLIKKKERDYHNSIEVYKEIQRVLFISLILLLIYLFTQIHEVIGFIQKFSKTSKKIIKNSTIKGIEPIDMELKRRELKEITKNYNSLIEKIDNSIEYANKSINITIESIENVEQNIEDFMELLATMDDKNSDDIFKKEDAVIESLETLISLKDRLESLERELKELI